MVITSAAALNGSSTRNQNSHLRLSANSVICMRRQRTVQVEVRTARKATPQQEGKEYQN